MTIAPFEPVERDGRIYGRGACDVKGGMAAMLAAFARLVRERPPDAANVVMSCTCDEESSVLGILDLVKLWSDPARRGSLLDSRPDAAVVAEPTELDVVVAHKGATRWKLRTRGRACHSSNPAEGVNAIYRMARVLECLEEFARRAAVASPAASVVRSADFQRRPNRGRNQRQYGPRRMHDRNRPPHDSR